MLKHREVDGQEDFALAAARQDEREIAAVDELHRQVVDLADHARLEDLDDVAVLEHRRDVGFAAEEIDRLRIGGELGRQPLDRDQLPRPRPLDGARLVHLGHPAPSEELQDLVLPEARRCGAHGCGFASALIWSRISCHCGSPCSAARSASFSSASRSW